MKKLTVLIIEDIQEYYDSFKRVVQNVKEFELQDLGLCNSIESAIEMVNKTTPDVVFMDHNLSTDNSGEGLEILRYLEKNFPKSVVISTTDLNAPDHGGHITISSYQNEGHELIAVSKDEELATRALKALVVFHYHQEKPIKVHCVHDGFATDAWKRYFNSKGIEKINEPNESCMILMTVSPDGHGGEQFEGEWGCYKRHSLPPNQIVNDLYDKGSRIFLVETNVTEKMPVLHQLERAQIDLFKVDEFLKNYIS